MRSIRRTRAPVEALPLEVQPCNDREARDCDTTCNRAGFCRTPKPYNADVSMIFLTEREWEEFKKNKYQVRDARELVASKLLAARMWS